MPEKDVVANAGKLSAGQVGEPDPRAALDSATVRPARRLGRDDRPDEPFDAGTASLQRRAPSAERRASEDPAIGFCSPIPASSTGVGIELAVDELYTDRVGVIVP